MGDLLLGTQAPSQTNAGTSGNAVVYVDASSLEVFTKDSSGFRRGRVYNFSTAAQTPAAGTRTYITGSAILANNQLQVGSSYRWRFNMTKTAAGIAASTFDIAIGTNGSTVDTARVSFTKPAGTAAIDEAWVEITCVIRGPISASGVAVGEFVMTHNGNTAGHATIPIVVLNTVSGTFDMTPANAFVGICITSGASDAITIQMVQAEAWNH